MTCGTNPNFYTTVTRAAAGCPRPTMNRDDVIHFQRRNGSNTPSKKEIIMRCSTWTLVVTLVLTAGIAAAQQPYDAH